MNSALIIIGILFLHWLFDFVAQSHKDAIGKSKSWNHLLSHTIQYSAWWIIPSFIFGIIVDNSLFVLFPIITFIFHTITDYYTSRDNSRLYAKGNMHDFFVGIGFDQWLHQVQLIGTWYLLNIL